MSNIIINEQYQNSKYYFDGGKDDKIFIGKKKLFELGDNPQNLINVKNQIRQGFVYKRVPHITLKEIGKRVFASHPC